MSEFVPPRLSPWRRVTAILALVLAVLALALTVLGTWNPWSSVVLRERAGDPVVDAFVVLLLLLIAYWVGLRVVSEADQHGRLMRRMGLIALTVFVGICALTTWGLQVFRYQPTVVATSPDGQRSVALVGVFQATQLHSFVGSGLHRRDEGSFGEPCGGRLIVRFVAADDIQVETDYGTFHLRTDPATGAPLKGLPRTCSG
jgi:succinate dehydrogenase hydrophobic anchor subunit